MTFLLKYNLINWLKKVILPPFITTLWYCFVQENSFYLCKIRNASQNENFYKNIQARF